LFWFFNVSCNLKKKIHKEDIHKNLINIQNTNTIQKSYNVRSCSYKSQDTVIVIVSRILYARTWGEHQSGFERRKSKFTSCFRKFSKEKKFVFPLLESRPRFPRTGGSSNSGKIKIRRKIVRDQSKTVLIKCLKEL